MFLSRTSRSMFFGTYSASCRTSEAPRSSQMSDMCDANTCRGFVTVLGFALSLPFLSSPVSPSFFAHCLRHPFGDHSGVISRARPVLENLAFDVEVRVRESLRLCGGGEIGVESEEERGEQRDKHVQVPQHLVCDAEIHSWEDFVDGRLALWEPPDVSVDFESECSREDRKEVDEDNADFEEVVEVPLASRVELQPVHRLPGGEEAAPESGLLSHLIDDHVSAHRARHTVHNPLDVKVDVQSVDHHTRFLHRRLPDVGEDDPGHF
mmetsp:Transcript_55774/g.127609  ORF Transcript_55774/g.127609 Transcript_55774/m.127609 type:complete len:265 (+) Transcript_55774:395-1189(+)